MKKKATKIISIILSVLLIFSVMPMTVLATDSVASVTTETGTTTEFATLQSAFDFAGENANSLVTLLSNINLGQESVCINNGEFTIDLNGKTISSTSESYVLVTKNDTEITIRDTYGNGKIENLGESTSFLSNQSAIDHKGALIIESGNFYGRHAIYSTGHLILKGGILEGWECGIYLYANTAAYSGGTINGGIYIYFDYSYGSTDTLISLRELLVSGYGFFDEDGVEFYPTTDQYYTYDNLTIKQSTTEKPYKAKLTLSDGTENSYIYIEDAYRDACYHNNSTITLLNDVEIAEPLENVFTNWISNHCLDLNGYTLTSTGSGVFYMPINVSSIYNLTLKDSIGTGEIVLNCSNPSSVSPAISGKSVVLENVKITSNCGGVFATNLTMNNCTVSATLEAVSGTNMIIKDSTISSELTGIKCGDGDISIYNTEITSVKNGIEGGKPQLYDGTKVVSSSSGYSTLSSNTTIDNCLAEGHFMYTLSGNEIDYSDMPYSTIQDFEVKNKFPVSVIQPDGTTEYFPSVDEGVDKANKDSDSTLKLLTDILLNSSLTFNGTTTLDLNGKNVALNYNNDFTVIVDDGASLDIIDSKEGGTIGSGGVVVVGGTLNLNRGNIDSQMDGILNAGGEVIINGGAISSGIGYDDIFVEGENTTVVYGGAYEDGFSIGGTTIIETLADGYVFYNGEGAVEITDNQKEVSDNVVVYEKTIVTAMSSQIRFNRNDDASYAGTFDVRTRAKISDADFQKYIAESNEDAINKISKVGFVYAQAKNGFDINIAKTVAQGDQADGFIDKPINYIQDADGYYMFTCLVTGIPEDELDNGLIAYAYICLDDTWYFFPVEVTAEFGELYSKYYPIAAEQYGWKI